MFYLDIPSLVIQTSFNPPEPPKDHWARDQPLPANLTKYKLRRYHGTVGVMDEAGTKILPELARHYISRDKYLNDFEQMVFFKISKFKIVFN